MPVGLYILLLIISWSPNLFISNFAMVRGIKLLNKAINLWHPGKFGMIYIVTNMASTLHIYCSWAYHLHCIVFTNYVLWYKMVCLKDSVRVDYYLLSFQHGIPVLWIQIVIVHVFSSPNSSYWRGMLKWVQ